MTQKNRVRDVLPPLILTIVIGLVLAIAVFWFSSWASTGSPETHFKEWTEGAYHLSLTVATIVAGMWGLYRSLLYRDKEGRIEVCHEVAQSNVMRARQVIHVTVQMANVSRTVARPRFMSVAIERIVPLSTREFRETSRNILRTSQEAWENAWPLIAKKKLEFPKGDMVIEPGESEREHVDFIAPPGLRKFAIATKVTDEDESNEEDWFAWESYTIHEVPVNTARRPRHPTRSSA